ncbi:MAG: hypothetical protein M3N00_00840 [Actinomycetota bacterium]|nr:hypothetical protein [Actinomycetota bacterium]
MLGEGLGLPRLELVWADGAYTREFRERAEEERGWRVEVPHHRDRQVWRYGLEEKLRARGERLAGTFAATLPPGDEPAGRIRRR